MTRITVCLALCLAAGAARAAAPTDAQCQARNNAAPARLAECMQTESLWRDLAHFQAIADANPGPEGHGNRDTGTSGYLASVDYVAGLMRAAGYAVTVQPYTWTHAILLADPVFEAGGARLAFSRDWAVSPMSGSGDIHTRVYAVAGTDGCDAGDFAAFPDGAMALMAPGTCGADIQLRNAAAAGARAAIFAPRAGVQETNRSRVQRLADLTAPAAIPVVTVTAAAAAALTKAGQDKAAHIDLRTERRSDTDYNVIAESPYGDPGSVVVADAHLDAIYGAGMLDNASGSVSILQTALALAKTPTRNRLRYIWFGGEELGLLGSHYYTRHLTPDELRKIAFDIDVDVTATPNFDVLVADPGHASNRRKFPANVIPQSQIGNQDFTQNFAMAGIPSRYAGFGNDGTDSNSFSLVGVPNTGVLTQQDCCKKPWEVRIWGGYTGDYEGLVPGVHHACVDTPGVWCDNLPNNDKVVFGFVSKAVAAVILQIADTQFAHTLR